MQFLVVLEKENFKFSVSHFTIFGAGQAERLHGHNYYVSVEVETNAHDPKLGPDFGMSFDFNALKPHVRDITAALDERVLLPELSPFAQITRKDGQTRVQFDKKRYEFPEEDVLVLPLLNVTSEELARHLAGQLAERIEKDPKLGAARIRSLTLGVQETRGQGVFYRTKIPSMS